MMRTLAVVVATLTFFVLAISGGAQAKQPLGQVRAITDTLFAASVGEAIQEYCPTISPRYLTVLSKAKALERQARDMGYSEDEIRAYRTSKAERARIDARRDAYLKANDVAPGNRDDHCRLGKAEIAAKSPIGVLLRNR